MRICVEHRRRLVAAVGIGLLLTTAVPVRAGEVAAVTVREPAFGLPHIFADTDLELARENGREIAKDRLGQIILLARVGRGTFSRRSRRSTRARSTTTSRRAARPTRRPS